MEASLAHCRAPEMPPALSALGFRIRLTFYIHGLASALRLTHSKRLETGPAHAEALKVRVRAWTARPCRASSLGLLVRSSALSQAGRMIVSTTIMPATWQCTAANCDTRYVGQS